MYQVMKSNEVLASLVAAICHDMDHPGVNQNYLVNTSSYLAAIHGVSVKKWDGGECRDTKMRNAIFIFHTDMQCARKAPLQCIQGHSKAV